MTVLVDLSQALEIIRLTDVGQMREHNEDVVASDNAIGLVVLADGMGGYKAGEVASEMACLSIMAELREKMLKADNLTPTIQTDMQWIQTAVANANQAIYQVSQSVPQCAGMGTTLVVGLFTDNKLLVGHIGDSRMYRLRQQQLVQITEDHSLLQEQIKAGLITLEQAKVSANKNLVTRAVGIDPEVALELHEHEVELADIYLVCSDGLTDLVEDSVIESTLNILSTNLTEAAKVLVQLANENGGKDNISVILVRINQGFERKPTSYHSFSWYDNLKQWFKQ
ncbi:MAG: Stp1/IreP family PP2C-type Ser/Thr phosphatase [Methylotenera sp.]|nr:Stp1/IreP family PP2C-type Ser/Thr phosphatase [Methylotenera sp.]